LESNNILSRYEMAIARENIIPHCRRCYRYTELVVLSACDTGLGEVQTGEAVFGLRRAFVLAGAQTLIMIIWNLPDKQTRKLMVDFYQGPKGGLGRGEALRKAQL
jgi:CHAT domain-containing protein